MSLSFFFFFFSFYKMLRQLSTLSKLTTSSIKYAANNTATFVGLPLLSREDTSLPLTQTTAYWISDTQKGLVINKE